MHNRVTELVNNYYRITSNLPDFQRLDDMWLAASDNITDAKIRSQLRKVNCKGYLKGHNDSIVVILNIPDSISEHFRSEE